MGVVLEQASLEAAVAELHHALDLLLAADPDLLSDEQTVTVVREFERARRRMEPADHLLIATVQQRGIPARCGQRNTAQWLRDALVVDIHEANARVRAAHAAGPRLCLLGEPLPATYPAVAAAQASGGLAAKQARVITHTLDKLPPRVCEEVPDAEARLVGFAATLDAAQLAQAAERERAWLDPDGGYRDVERRRKERDLRFTQRPDGSCTFAGQGTAELGEFLQVAFDSLGAPTPAADGALDPRTAGQRRHDALLDALKSPSPPAASPAPVACSRPWC